MLVVYSSVLRRENFLRRYAEDCHSASMVANDLTCNLKSLSMMSSEGKLDLSLQEIEQAEKNLKEVSALLSNLRENLQGYVGSLVPKVNEPETEEENKQEKLQADSSNDKQITDILSAIKSLKEMKDSLGQ